MTLLDYQNMQPEPGEDTKSYCLRLEQDGHEEMFIRKALRMHFSMKIDEFGAFFEDYELARLRHLAMLKQIHPNRNSYSLKLKVRKNLGISEERANYWVKRFEEVGELDYIGATR